MRPPFGNDPSRLYCECNSPISVVKPTCVPFILLAIKQTLGYYHARMKDVNKAASLMGRESAKARLKKWGKKEFVRKMQKWGKLGGRPKGSGKKSAKRGEL